MTVWAELVGQEAVVAQLREAASAARLLLAVDAVPTAGELRAGSGMGGFGAEPVTSGTHVDAAVPGFGMASARSMTHSWLLTGPPGSGRSIAALAFAAALQCTGDVIGCGQCAGCRTAMLRSHADIRLVSTEATQIRVAEVRDLIGRAQLAPTQGRWRVIIIEDADRMSEHTANVLLKAIEEPPERTVWILCAPSSEDMLPTIRSRCRHVALRIPAAQAVADLLVARDGVDPEVALASARAAQSHIGLARALARDPKARQRRRDIITAPVRVRSVGEAVFAAEKLLEVAQEETAARLEARHAEEKATLLRQLGMDEADTRNRQGRARLKELEDEQKRRAKRAIHDTLDRALVDLLAIYRDVLMIQLNTGAALVNVDLADVVAEIAEDSSPQQTLARTRAIEVARQRLVSNVAPQLALEAMAVSLRPQM
ncbi:DNA polymerase III subunit delta' [Schaalia suimastitidis]|uniref:DNA polymerase III subunit delta' n=1 Tax=Schaalia suimastitidis TaxID=121163 RepID=UPI000421E0B7|nr:DNA polymerase III subunit delta' [Schaalia suimastitidis]